MLDTRWRTFRRIHRSVLSMISIALLLLSITAAIAQQPECIKIWEPWRGGAPYVVNVDTGNVTESQPAHATAELPHGLSPDGRYIAEIDWSHNQKLRLTDSKVGVTALLSENASDFAWSPDGSRLAYNNSSSNSLGVNLNVLRVETGEILTLKLSPEQFESYSQISWSPDGQTIVNLIFHNVMPEAWDVHIISTSDLTIRSKGQVAIFSPNLLWSPSGSSLLLYGSSGTAYLMNAQSQRLTPFAVYSDGNSRFKWSPDEKFLLITHAQNDWLDVFDVVDMRGKRHLENIIVDSNYDGSHAFVEWENDSQIVAAFAHVETAIYDLVEFDATTGQRRLIQPDVSWFRLSPDGHYVASALREKPDIIHIFDVSTDKSVKARALKPDSAYANFIWRADRLELLVLLKDRWLRVYDYTADAWRDIATIPGEVEVMEQIDCSNA
ncbi:MAG: hypothetical protein R3E39_15180 [Anaerolineae bacterium]